MCCVGGVEEGWPTHHPPPPVLVCQTIAAAAPDALVQLSAVNLDGETPFQMAVNKSKVDMYAGVSVFCVLGVSRRWLTDDRCCLAPPPL